MKFWKRAYVGFTLIELGMVLVGMCVISLVLMGVFRAIYAEEVSFLQEVRENRDVMWVHHFIELFWRDLRVSERQPFQVRSWDDGSWFIGAPYWGPESPYLVQANVWNLLFFCQESEFEGTFMYIRADSTLINADVLRMVKTVGEIDEVLEHSETFRFYRLKGIRYMRLGVDDLFALGVDNLYVSFPQCLLSDVRRFCHYQLAFNAQDQIYDGVVPIFARFYADSWEWNLEEEG